MKRSEMRVQWITCKIMRSALLPVVKSRCSWYVFTLMRIVSHFFIKLCTPAKTVKLSLLLKEIGLHQYTCIWSFALEEGCIVRLILIIGCLRMTVCSSQDKLIRNEKSTTRMFSIILNRNHVRSGVWFCQTALQSDWGGERYLLYCTC